MTRLSVNINKIATLRNARGGNIPDVLKAAVDCQRFGAEGITVHPRPDERHIRYQDVLDLRPMVKTEFNIEGYTDKRFLDLVKRVNPEQVTLVPDAPDAITSNQGWDTITHKNQLVDIITELKEYGIRPSIFVDTDPRMVEAAALTGTTRIELYTEPYASNYSANPEGAIRPFVEAANVAHSTGLEINAGHDLNLENLKFLVNRIPRIKEVSIGHALIAEALYYGLENTIQMYLRLIK